jgi:hypothetical protein
MAFPPNNYGSSSGAYGTRGVSGDSGSVNLALDNMIRNQLKVSDPRNPKQIADALLNYYQNLPQAASIAQEAQGLPFLLAPQQTQVLPPLSTTSSDREFSIASNDVERALNDLSTSALTNDIIPEMQGWALAIRAAITDGSTAARQGLDPRMRDRTLGLRRQLGEFAQTARFTGSLYPGMTQNFRRLGQALDEVAAVLLVMLGEALANVGFASGYFLLQVPFTELQARRDGVIYGLRNFMGGAQQAYGPDDWPRGVAAYRLLFNRLEQQGHGDLRTLLVENEVARVMDELISRAQNGSAEGLRALGVTAQLSIEQFRRLAIVAPGALGDNNFNSPPLAAFLEALQLFADAFTPAGGLRLLRVARPPVLFYGLYSTGSSPIDDLLLRMIRVRGNLATVLDTLFLGSGASSMTSQVLFDMLLTALDRAIDLLASGAEGTADDDFKQGRAFAHWLIIRAILMVFQQDPLPINQAGSLTYDEPVQGPRLPDQIDLEFVGQAAIEGRLRTEARNMRTNFLNHTLNAFPDIFAELTALFNLQNNILADQTLWESILEELLVQKNLERRRPELVRTIAPEAGRQDDVFRWRRLVVMQPFSILGALLPPARLWNQPEIPDSMFPPQYEQSLQIIARNS